MPAAGASGVVIAQGGAFGGWVLHVRDGKPAYTYNLFGLQRTTVEGEAAIPAGTHQVRMEFDYDGGGLGRGATVVLYVDGARVGDGRLEATVPLAFSFDETADIGRDTASPVSDDYSAEASVFRGAISWVQLDVAEAAEDVDHLISPDERLRLAMARQ